MKHGPPIIAGKNPAFFGPKNSNMTAFLIYHKFDLPVQCKFKIRQTIRDYRPAQATTTNHKWDGACLDTGTQQTVVGLAQAKAYCRFTGTKFKAKPSPMHFRFGNYSQASLGTMNISILIADGYLIREQVETVKANVPFPIGLDLLDEYHMFIDSVNNMLRSPERVLNVHLLRKQDHIYLEWDHSSKMHFTKAALIKLHRGFPIPYQRTQ